MNMNKRKRINLLQNDIDDSDGEQIQEVSTLSKNKALKV